MKLKLFSIVLTILLSLPVCVQAVDSNVRIEEPIAVENTLDEDIESEISQDTQYKEPLSRRKIAKKFLYAMGGVAISSFTIFFLLTIYNRVRENYLNQVKTPEGETSLETPDDLNGAIRTFLDKTKWS